jgi:hypothetical protein
MTMHTKPLSPWFATSNPDFVSTLIVALSEMDAGAALLFQPFRHPCHHQEGNGEQEEVKGDEAEINGPKAERKFDNELTQRYRQGFI